MQQLFVYVDLRILHVGILDGWTENPNKSSAHCRFMDHGF